MALRNLLPDWENIFNSALPNSFSIEMGKLIRRARVEASLSQAELAKKIYLRRASLSNMENGKMYPNAEVLLLLAENLEKPLVYFFPLTYTQRISREKLEPLEQELLLQTRRLDEDDLRKLVAMARSLANLAQHDTEQTLEREAAHREQLKRSNQPPDP